MDCGDHWFSLVIFSDYDYHYDYDDSQPMMTSRLITSILRELQAPGIKSLIKCSLFRGFAVITGKPLYLWLENE